MKNNPVNPMAIIQMMKQGSNPQQIMLQYLESNFGQGNPLAANLITLAKQNRGRPSMIVLNTIKGKGFSYSETAGVDNHSMPVTKEHVELAKEELK